jgi:hypothetical protein
MTRGRVATVLLAVLCAPVLVAGCGGGEDTSAGPSSSSPPATTTGSASSSTPSTHGDGDTHAPPFPANTAPDTGAASSGALVTVTDIRTGHHDGFDRVVFEVDGTGTPGWDVRYVDEAIEQGRGETVPVAGKAILQVTITGVGYPTDTGIAEYDGRTLPGSHTDVVTEVVWDSTFEGTSVAVVGTTAEAPFRVYLLDDPARVVLEVVHHD